jgi:hypothetical protein
VRGETWTKAEGFVSKAVGTEQDARCGSPACRLAAQSSLNDRRYTGRYLSSRVFNVYTEDVPVIIKDNGAEVCWSILFTPYSSIFHKEKDAMKIGNQTYIDKNPLSSCNAP